MDYPFPEEQIGLPGISHVTPESKKWWILTWAGLFIAFGVYIGFLGAQAHQEGVTPATRVIISRNLREDMPALTICPLTPSENIQLASPTDSDAPNGTCTVYTKPTGVDADPFEIDPCQASLTTDGKCVVVNPNANVTVLPRTDFIDIVVRVDTLAANSIQGVSYTLTRSSSLQGTHTLNTVDRFEAPLGSRSHVRWFRTAWINLKKQAIYTYQASASAVPLSSGDAPRDARTVVIRLAAGRSHDESIEEYRPTTALVFLAAIGAVWGYIVVVIACLFVPFYGRDGQRWVKVRFTKSSVDPIYADPDTEAVGPGGSWAEHRANNTKLRTFSYDSSGNAPTSTSGTES